MRQANSDGMMIQEATPPTIHEVSQAHFFTKR